jgi:signal peptidase II
VPLIGGLVLLSDFITKRLIEAYISPENPVNLLPFLRIVYVKNRGAAFGILSNLDNNIFIFVSIIAIMIITIYLFKTNNRLEIYALSMIVGGAVGNLIDRIQIGQVIDFIDFFIGQWHWPAFNIADSALTVGIILFLISHIKHN